MPFQACGLAAEVRRLYLKREAPKIAEKPPWARQCQGTTSSRAVSASK